MAKKKVKKEKLNEEIILQNFYVKEYEAYSFDDIILSDKYDACIYEIREKILNNFTEEKSEEVNVIFGNNIYTISKGNLLTYLILAEPFHVHSIPFNEDLLFEITDNSSINNYLDKLIKYFRFELDININEILVHTISTLSILSSKVLGSYAVTINLYDLCELIKKNDEFEELMKFNLASLNRNIEFKEATTIINEKFKDVLKILKSTDNCYNVLLKSKAGINDRQLKDTIFLVGFKPDEKGYIIPEPADNSYLTGNDIIGFYVDAVGGRKALMINKKNTKKSGYLTRKLTLLTLDNYIDNEIDDCGTKHYVNKYIDSQDTLNRYIYRNYYVKKNGKRVLKSINPETDTHLIGKTIKLRSPIKCACNNGKICKACYGELWKYNLDKNVGIVGTLILTNQNTQLQLSAKHNLQASINEISWGEDFLKYFTVNKEKIYLNENIGNKTLFYIPEFLETDEFDDSDIFDTIIIEENKKEPIKITLPKNLIINDDVLNYEYDSSKDAYLLNVKGLSDNDILFTYIMNNNELSSSLNNIITLIETNSFIKDHSIDEIVDRFITLLNNSPLIVHGIHIEILIKELCKIHNNDRNLFKKKPKKDSDYPIEDVYRVTDAIIKNPSLSKSIVYQEQYRQITQMPETYFKDKPSIIDGLLK